MKIKKKFAQVANAIIRNKELSNGAFRVFCELLTYRYYDGRIFPAHNTMAKDIGVDVRTIRNHIKELKRLGLVSWKKQGFSKSNNYVINDEKFFTNDHLNDENNFSSNRKELSQNVGKSFQPNNSYKNTNLNNSAYERCKAKVEEIRRGI